MSSVDPDVLSHLMSISQRLGNVETTQGAYVNAQRKLVDEISALSERGDQTNRELFARLTELANEISDLPRDKHNKHHHLLDQMIERESARRQFWFGIKLKLASGGFWAAMTALAFILWFAFNTYIGKPPPSVGITPSN